MDDNSYHFQLGKKISALWDQQKRKNNTKACNHQNHSEIRMEMDFFRGSVQQVKHSKYCGI